MALIPERELGRLFELNKSFWAGMVRDPSVPQSVKSMIYQHLLSQWVPGALAVVVSPLSAGLDNFLKQSSFDLGGIQYYYPSLNFWMAHAAAAHPPEGSGCDAAAHTAFLTRDGASPEFIYSIVTRDGNLVVQDAEGFSNECAFFRSGNS